MSRKILFLKIVMSLALIGIMTGCGREPAGISEAIVIPRPPAIYPEYSGAVIPPNIAPLNFSVREEGEDYFVRIRSSKGRTIDVHSANPGISIPLKPWKKLLADNKGQPLLFDIHIKTPEGTWEQFSTITNHIAREQIDSHLVYRLIPPIHHSWHKIEIHQRCIENFSERRMVDNRTFKRGCVNCHTFKQNSPDTMSFQVRSRSFGLPMLVVKDNKISNIDTRTDKGVSPAAYHSWHPGGEIIAFSRNKPSPFEHTGPNIRDVWDDDSDLAIYFVASNRVETPSEISDPEWRETWPSWSSDGRTLYFCRAPQIPVDQFEKVKYDLMRISYDPIQNKWGEPEVLVSGKQTGRSTAQPRESPDGKWLLFSMFDYGNFPIYQPSADLYVVELGIGRYRRLHINSDLCDSWHSWSSNSRWVVFASKRGNGLMARVYFSHVDPRGRFHKPFILPQHDPAFYDSCVRTFNVPELITGPIQQTASQFGAAICEPDTIMKAPGTPEHSPEPSSDEWHRGPL